MIDGAAVDDLIACNLRDDVRHMHAYMVGDARGLVKLDAMENPYGLPAPLVQQLTERLSGLALNRYPDATARALRQAISKRAGLSDQHDVLLGNGSDELISIMVAACARQNGCVMSLGPGFVMYRLSAQISQVRHVEVPLRADFHIDVDATLEAIRREQPNLIFIAYPNNPTGTLFRRADIEEIIGSSSGLIVIDEAYEAFSADSYLQSVLKSPRLLLLRTLSKVGLAGIRLGYLIGDRQLIAEFDKVRPPYNVNILTQCTAEFALEHEAVLLQQAAELVRQRQMLMAALAARPLVEVFESRANFLLFRLQSSSADAAAQVFSGIRAHGVLIKNVSSSHPLLHNCLRVTVSTPDENQAFLDAFDRVWPGEISRAA